MSLAANVYLGVRLSPTPGVVPPAFAVGTKAPALYAQDLNGAQVSVQWNGSTPTLLYIFSPFCTWCRRNSNNFDLLARSQGSHFRVISLSLTDDGLKDYVRAHNVPGLVLSRPDRVKSGLFTRSMTPTTILVSSDGTIERVWRGAYRGAVREDLEKKFGMQLAELPLTDPYANSHEETDDARPR